MADITKDDLLFDDYNWKAKQQGDDPKKKKSDSDRFSRYEGYEMLYLLNEGLPDSNKLSIATKQRIEWSIRTRLPSGSQSRKDVVKWIIENEEIHKKAYQEYREKQSKQSK
ncbi:hypothetical protein [Kosakonia sp. MH5]|uniref:hypothetical protein n=1 Tax=Kosakonia sp. MH5 TaxID=2202822 RepID=UPI001374C7FA|nr:hypothetical protein [Kosakonia sp. MH5]NCF07963.1 hypothetical protein [Kosakonia sp. MH5]